MGEVLKSIIAQLNEIADPAAIGAKLAQLAVNMVVGLIIFAAFYLVWRLVNLLLAPLLQRRFDKTSGTFIETIVKYTILSVGLINAFDAVGVQTSALLTSLGIAGLTIGFAARDALSNLISGILIFIDRPFVIGDLVELEGFYGRVDRITLRSTRIVTSDGRMLAVPNTEVINKTVASYTNFPHLRLDIPVTVAVTEDLGRARRLLLDLVTANPNYMVDPQPRVVVTQLNDYNVVLELQAWLHDERQHIERRFELREWVFATLTSAGVEMPFETFAMAPLAVDLHGAAPAAA